MPGGSKGEAGLRCEVFGKQEGGSVCEICVHTRCGAVLLRPEQCRAALVLGAKDLLVAGHHLAVVHVHDLGANLTTGGGHWGRGQRRRYQWVTGGGEIRRGGQGAEGT